MHLTINLLGCADCVRDADAQPDVRHHIQRTPSTLPSTLNPEPQALHPELLNLNPKPETSNPSPIKDHTEAYPTPGDGLGAPESALPHALARLLERLLRLPQPHMLVPPEPCNLKRQPQTLNPQSSGLDSQPSTLKPLSSTLDPES